MTDLDHAVAQQLANMERRTGKSLAQLSAVVQHSGLAKHGELVTMLKSTLGMGHGDANLLVHLVRGAATATSTPDTLASLYSGPKAALRPIHDALLPHLHTLGDFEEAPKKGYISYRRGKQFVMVGPATNTRVEVGLNRKDLSGGKRLIAQPSGRMCHYIVKLTDPQEVDAELLAWIAAAYDAAG